MTCCSFDFLNTRSTTKPKTISITFPRSIRRRTSTLATSRRRIENRYQLATSSRARSSSSGGSSDPMFRLCSILQIRTRQKRRRVFLRLRPRSNGSFLRRTRERCCLKRNFATRASLVVRLIPV